MNPFDLTGKVAIVTGSSRGIGRAIAESFVQFGASVAISSRKQEQCDIVCAALNQVRPNSAIAVAANISRKEDLQHLVQKTRDAFGKVDILVCNAATNPYYGPLGGISDEQFRKIMDNNVLANHWLAQLCLPEMIERRDGSVIIVSSIGGLRGTAVLGAYTVSKAADLQLARSLAVEVGPHNVRVNCIAPGLIRTDFARALWEDESRLEKVNTQLPLRRIGDPQDIAGTALLLASSAGSYITGQVIVVDGGSTA